MVRRTKQEALATREQLLDAAEGLFLGRGMSRTSLQDIASAAGLTRGAVYWHFEDKMSLVEAMMNRALLPWEQALADIERLSQRDALASLRALALLPLTLVRENLRVRRLLTIYTHRIEYTDDQSLLRERHLASINAYRDQLRCLVHEAQRQGQLPATLQAPSAALGLFALVDGLMSYATLMPENLAALKDCAGIIDRHLAGLHAA